MKANPKHSKKKKYPSVNPPDASKDRTRVITEGTTNQKSAFHAIYNGAEEDEPLREGTSCLMVSDSRIWRDVSLVT